MNSAQWLLLVRFMCCVVRYIALGTPQPHQSDCELWGALEAQHHELSADLARPAMDQAELAKRNVVSGDEFLKAREAIFSEPTP